MEVTDDGDTYALLIQLLNNRSDSSSSFLVVDGDTNQLRTSPCQRGNLLNGTRDIRGIGVGHGLHHDWCIRANADAADLGGYCFSTLNLRHGETSFYHVKMGLGFEFLGSQP